MPKFKMDCSCGDTMEVDKPDRESAVQHFKDMMTESSIATHFAEKHPTDPVVSVADCHAMIEKDVKEVV